MTLVPKNIWLCGSLNEDCELNVCGKEKVQKTVAIEIISMLLKLKQIDCMIVTLGLIRFGGGGRLGL